jgi:hypothetical protein
MLVHMIQEIVDRHCRDLPQRSRDNLVQEILLRIDENFLVVPADHQLSLMVKANSDIPPEHW